MFAKTPEYLLNSAPPMGPIPTLAPLSQHSTPPPHLSTSGKSATPPNPTAQPASMHFRWLASIIRRRVALLLQRCKMGTKVGAFRAQRFKPACPDSAPRRARRQSALLETVGGSKVRAVKNTWGPVSQVSNETPGFHSSVGGSTHRSEVPLIGRRFHSSVGCLPQQSRK